MQQKILGEQVNPFEEAIQITLADDDFVDIAPSGPNGGFGKAQMGDGEEFTIFSFTSAGAVTLIANSTNVVNTDTDANFCIFSSGAVIRFKNRLGSTKNLIIVAWLSK